jgi:hypothetical protein
LIKDPFKTIQNHDPDKLLIPGVEIFTRGISVAEIFFFLNIVCVLLFAPKINS